MTANWYVVSFWGGGNVLNQIVVMAAQLCEYTKKHRIVHFKWVNFVVCELDRSSHKIPGFSRLARGIFLLGTQALGLDIWRIVVV